jgi:glycosyltransferase involved in cell wall biosynthesis
MSGPTIRLHGPIPAQLEQALVASGGVLVTQHGEAQVELVGGVSEALALDEHQRERAWVLVEAVAEWIDAAPAELRDAVGNARWVLCGCERDRALLETWLPEVSPRVVVVPEGQQLSAWASRLVATTFPEPDVLGHLQRPLRVVFAGHDLGFLNGLIRYLQGMPAVEIRLDHVKVFTQQDEERSASFVEWADVVFCEWLSPVAAWYSRHRRDDQRLIVRLHRMELYNHWTDLVDINSVDQIVCVSPHYRRLTMQRTGWPENKVTYVPNYVDVSHFDRSKLVGARRTLGFIGVVPSRKRLDLALDIVERLRQEDPDWVLFVKGKLWWDYPWNWRNESERMHASEVLHRIQSSSALANGVVFDSHGADVATWLRKVGYVLSTSDDESFHLAPAEGMASGALPVIRSWAGAGTIYASEWLHDDVDDMSSWILDVSEDDAAWAEHSIKARSQVARSIDVEVVASQLLRVMVDNPTEPLSGEPMIS